MKPCLITMFFASLAALHAADTPKRPTNVLLMITDQQCWDAMSCAGNPVLRTPNLDKLAAEGARFYCGKTGHESEGSTLRPLIEGREDGNDCIAVSECPFKRVPGFMVCDGRWKLLYGRAKNAPSLDALYDLQSDPHELNNLIGSNPDQEKHRADAERMKGLLMEWLVRVKSPHLEVVRERPLLVESRLPNSKRKQ